MNTPECFSRNVRKMRRGFFFFWVISLVLSGLSGWLFFLPAFQSWAFVLLIVGAVSLAALKHISKRLNLVRMVVNNPENVYWLHPIDRMGVLLNTESQETRLIALHLKNGMKLELSLKSGEHESLVVWIKEKNAFIRSGNYE